MSRCRKCGDESWGKNLCDSCRSKRVGQRRSAFDQAVEEIGPLTAETHQAIVKRVKQLEKEAKASGA